MREYLLCVGGSWRAGSAGSAPAVSPSSGETFATVAVAGRPDVDDAVANGKVLLAYGVLPLPRPGTLERYTPRTITTPAELATELDQVRKDGYATAVAELEEGLVAVAAPVFDPAGTCVAALSVSGPEFRMLPESLAGLGQLCATA